MWFWRSILKYLGILNQILNTLRNKCFLENPKSFSHSTYLERLKVSLENPERFFVRRIFFYTLFSEPSDIQKWRFLKKKTDCLEILRHRVNLSRGTTHQVGLETDAKTKGYLKSAYL
jgi:hypothetical protein